MKKLELVKDYREDTELRASFNALAQQIYGLDFEDWYQNGYWGGSYNPYSIVDGGRVIANVSVNLTDFLWDGRRKRFIQLGTVMTAEEYRNQGLIRRLMEEIEKDFGKLADGMYLFANDRVLNFYPKFGFVRAEEYQYTKAVYGGGEQSVVQVPMRDKSAWAALEEALRKCLPCGRFCPVDNPGLTMFYITKFMQENVYYDRKRDAYVIAELDDGELLLHQIISSEPVSTEEIIRGFGGEIRRVRLGFTPADTEGYTVSEVKAEDTTLFLKGEGFAGFAQSHLLFPPLAHA